MKSGKNTRLSSIIITHDIRCARAVANRVIMLADGEVHLEGTLETFEKSNDPLNRGRSLNRSVPKTMNCANAKIQIRLGLFYRGRPGAFYNRNFFNRQTEKFIRSRIQAYHDLFTMSSGLAGGKQCPLFRNQCGYGGQHIDNKTIHGPGRTCS